MITQFGFKNFKAWQTFGPARFAPLTILFGSNSSGKSSIAQFLLMLKQTVESQDRRMVLNIGGSKTAVDLGNFYEIAFAHDESRRIAFDLTWNLPAPLILTDSYHQRDYSGIKMRFESEVGIQTAKGSTLGVERMVYTFGDLQQTGMKAGMVRTDRPNAPYDLIQENYEFVRNPGRVWPITEPTKCYGFPDEVVNYYQNAEVVKALALSFEQLFQGLFYLGPLRERFSRQYSWTGEAPEHVGWKGEHTIAAILAAKDRKVSPGKKMRSRHIPEIIAEWLQQMGLIEAFEVKPIAPKRREYEVLVKTPGSGKWVNITDVGFGISQFLPVLVQCFYAAPRSVILIEQPEIHLHPAAQLWLADLLIEVIHSRENGQPRNLQLIIESHSEHFLRRLQRRIAEKQLSRDEVAAYFCQPTPEGASITPLDVDFFGNIRNWPENFFGDTMSEAVTMNNAQMERLAKGENPNG
jgi:predicted ATPase